MPFGDFINVLPPPVFLVIHLAAFAIGAFFAWRSFDADAPLLAWAFTLYAAGELTYMTYHLDWTVILFAHTIAEVFNLVAFVLVFVAATRGMMARLRGSESGA
jgi:hypothetical protein